MKSASFIAKSGILTAASVMLLYLSRISPTNKIALLVLASFMVPVAIITMNLRQGLLVYSATALISFFVVGGGLVPLYILFFGPYGIVKHLIENLRKSLIEILLKLFFFNICFFILYYLGGLLVLDISSVQKHLILFCIAAQIFFVAFDYSLTILISFFIKRILRR